MAIKIWASWGLFFSFLLCYEANFSSILARQEPYGELGQWRDGVEEELELAVEVGEPKELDVVEGELELDGELRELVRPLWVMDGVEDREELKLEAELGKLMTMLNAVEEELLELAGKKGELTELMDGRVEELQQQLLQQQNQWITIV